MATIGAELVRLQVSALWGVSGRCHVAFRGNTTRQTPCIQRHHRGAL